MCFECVFMWHIAAILTCKVAGCNQFDLLDNNGCVCGCSPH